MGFELLTGLQAAWMVVYDSEGENDANSPILQPFQPHLGPEPENYSAPSPPQRRRKSTLDPGDAPLIENLGPNNPELARYGQDFFEAASDSSSERSPAMTDHIEVAQDPEDRAAESSAAPGDGLKSEHLVAEFSGIDDAKSLEAQAAAAVEAASRVEADSHRHAVTKRVDSAHDEVQQLAPEKRPPRSGRNSPLKLQTDQFLARPDDTIATSPTLRKYAIPVAEGTAGTLPALQPTSPTKDGSTSSPRTERLPSFRQLTGQLPELAEAATQHDLRGQKFCHHHTQSFGSVTSQSPTLPYHPHPINVQTSPSSQYAYSARSPTSTIGDHHYGSPAQYPGPAYYTDRTPSAVTENTAPLPASLPSASSSGDSHGPASSSTDGYSTNHTTPIDGAIAPDGTPRQIPILPPPAGMPHGALVIAGSFKCDWPGCFAAPFQTQYLLRY